MSYANNTGGLPTPQYITTIDLTVDNKQKFNKYFNYNVFNFAKKYSNPLILPFTITLDVIYHGPIDIGTNKFDSKTFGIGTVTDDKFHMTGDGTAYFWYRYGSIEPASFQFIGQTAIDNKDWLVLDAVLHSRSIIEAIDFVVNHQKAMPIFAKGFDWQFNEIGASDFFSYLLNDYYDVRKLAQFLTIMAYIDPETLTKTGFPVYNYNDPNHTFEEYLMFLPQTRLPCTSTCSPSCNQTCTQTCTQSTPQTCNQGNSTTCYPNQLKSCT